MTYVVDAQTIVKSKWSCREGMIFILQRKHGWRWRTTVWTYPSTHKGNTIQEVASFLLWKEENGDGSCTTNFGQRMIAKRIMENYAPVKL